MTYAIAGLARAGTRSNYIPHTLQCQIGKIWYPSRAKLAKANITRSGLREFTYGFTTLARGSLQIEETGLGEVPTCSFSIECDAANRPVDGDTVTIFVGTFRQALFGGILVNPKETKIAHNTYQYDCTAEGYLKYLHTRHVKHTFKNMSSGAIVKSIIDTYFPHGKLYCGNRIHDGIIIESLDCNYKTVYEICKDLAERNNYILHVTATREVCFEPQSSSIAPWDLTPDEIFSDLTIDEDSSDIRNRIIIQYSQLVPKTESFVGDMETEEFLTTEQIYTVQELTVNNIPVTYGERNKEDNSENDFSIQYEDKIIQSRAYGTLSDLDTLRISYIAKKPACLIYNDLASQQKRQSHEGYDGIYEFVIEDRENILSRQAAIDRAIAEINLYAFPLISASYQRQESLETFFKNRLHPGMIQSITVRERNQKIIIEKISLSVLAPASDATLVFLLNVSLSPIKKDLTTTIQKIYASSDSSNLSPNETIEIISQ